MLYGGEEPLLVVPEMITGYERIKTLKKDLHRNITELLALARQNDPFYAGSELDWAQARWFKRMWERLGFVQGVHLRRIHYRILDLDDRKKHDGTPYENTEADWKYLEECSKAARILRKVPAEAFIDRRNPAAHLPNWIAYSYGQEHGPRPSHTFPETFERYAWRIPVIQSMLRFQLGLWNIPFPTLDGYDDSDWADRPYYLEVWVEKSTQDDILLPVCQDLGIALVTSVGFQSMTRAIELLHRVKRIGKPTRILYISDFDPAGDGMPVAVARHLEYWLPVYAPGADIKLLPLALTHKQVTDHRLHRIPIKDEDRRKANFEERYGEGAVELDALESRVPGTLEALVREAVAPYEDDTLLRRLREAETTGQRTLQQEWVATIRPYQVQLRDIRTEAEAILSQYEDRLAELNTALQAQLAPLKEQLQEIRENVDIEIERFNPELPERPAPEIEPPDENDWFFDGRRDYLAQLSFYKARKPNVAKKPRKPRVRKSRE